MFKYIFSKTIIYFVILIFILPVVILFLFGNLSRKNTTKTTSEEEVLDNTLVSVPTPTKEDIIKTFCSLIDEGDITKAISMMDLEDDDIKQSWGVIFNNFSSFKLIEIQKSKIDVSGNSFEVLIDVSLKKDLVDLPIPNYGWFDGENTRWINLIEETPNVYKISEIATGP